MNLKRERYRQKGPALLTEYGYIGRQRGCEVFREDSYGFSRIGTFNLTLRQTTPGSYAASKDCSNTEVKNLLWKKHINFSAQDSYLVGYYNTNSYYIRKEKDTAYEGLIIKIDDGSKNRTLQFATTTFASIYQILETFFNYLSLDHASYNAKI